MDNTLKGYWIFSKIIDISNITSFNVNFKSQGGIGEDNYECIELRITDVGLSYVTSDNLHLVYSTIYDDYWSSEARRTIQITSDLENVDLLAYLQENAVKVLPATAVQNSIASYVRELGKVRDVFFEFLNNYGIAVDNSKLSVSVFSNLDKIVTGLFSPRYADANRKIVYNGTSLREYAFYDYNDGTFDFPNLTKIPNYCFSGANYIEILNAENVNEIGAYAFLDCVNTKNVIFPNCTKIGMHAFNGAHFSRECIIDVSNAETVGDYAFITKFPDYSTGTVADKPLIFNKNVKFGNYVFKGSSNTGVKYLEIKECTEIADYMFEINSSIQLINAPKVTKIGTRAFAMDSASEPTNLTPDKLILGDVTSIGNEAFKGCTAWTKGDWDFLLSIGNYTFRNTALTSFNAPNMTTAGTGSFYGCTSLESFNAPITTIYSSFFYNCSNLKNLKTGDVIAIQQNAFYKCTSITELDYPNCTTIATDFVAYTNITKIRLGVSSIPANAFRYINGAFDLFLNYDGVVTLASSNAFYSNNQSKMVTVHVKAEYAEAYETASIWSSIKNKCTIVGDYTTYYPDEEAE